MEGEFLKTSDGAHLFLAEECFARQINGIRLDSGFSGQDLDGLFSLLAEDPEQVRALGGAAAYISARSTDSLTVAEVDYSGILERRKETSPERGSSYAIDGQAKQPAMESGVAPGTDNVSPESLSPAVFDDPGVAEVSLEDRIGRKLKKLDEAADPASYKSALMEIRESLRAVDAMSLDRYTATVFRHLGSHLTSERPGEMLTLVQRTLMGFSVQGPLEDLARDLSHRSAVERDRAIAVLQAVGDTSIPALLKCLSEEDEAFGRKAMITALGEFGEAMRPHLLEWLDDDRWYVLRNIIDLLSLVHTDEDSSKVISFLDHNNKQVRLAALRFMMGHPARMPEERIQALLADTDRDVRARAIYAIGVLKGERGLGQLFDLAKKPAIGQGDIATREGAIKGIGRVGGNEAIRFLEGLLNRKSILDPDGSSRIRKAAVGALVKIGGPGATSVLRGAVKILKGEARRQAEVFLRQGAERAE